MKNIEFLGDSKENIRNFPKAARKSAGEQLEKIQNGLQPDNWKPMASVGAGVREIRIHVGGAFRVFYVTKIGEKIYVLHAFQKKTQKTEKKDIDLAKARLKTIL